MKTKLSTCTAIALITTIGVATLSTSAFAQDNSRDGGQRDRQMGPRHHGGQVQARGPERGSFPLLALTCAPNAAERYETMLDAVGGRLELTAAQTTAFETFHTAALTAQSNFSNTCAAFASVDENDKADTNLVDRLIQRQVIMSAQVDAMDDVLPALEAFYNSLTDAQKADLMPHRGDGFGPRGMHTERGDHGSRSDVATPAPAIN